MKAITATLVTDGALHIAGLPVALIVPIFTALGFTYAGQAGANPEVREELHGVPVFRELFLIGDANGVARYETRAAFEMLSR